jgi:hypothetical protein
MARDHVIAGEPVDFHDTNLRTDGGLILGFTADEKGVWTAPEGGGLEIEIQLQPFELEGYAVDPDDESNTIRTSISLSDIHLPVRQLSKLAGQTYRFPVNPTPGYIDGSIYVGGVHNPVEVTELCFGKLIRDTEIEVTATMRMLFEFEDSGYRDRDANVRATLKAARHR